MGINLGHLFSASFSGCRDRLRRVDSLYYRGMYAEAEKFSKSQNVDPARCRGLGGIHRVLVVDVDYR